MARKPTFKRSFDIDYNPQSLTENLTAAQINKEYSRLRKIFRKRMERLERSDFNLSNAALKGRSMRRGLKKTNQLRTETKAAKISEMTEWLERRSSTVKGARDIRRETRERLEEYLSTDEKPFRFKNYQQFRLFGQFMDYLRAVYKKDLQYIADDVLELFHDYSEDVLNDSMSFNEIVDKYLYLFSLLSITFKIK